MDSLHVRVLERAAEKIGSKTALCDYLQVPFSTLRAWLCGGKTPPDIFFLKALQIIGAQPRISAASVIERARQLLYDTDILRAAIVETREHQQRIKASCLAGRTNGFLAETFERRERKAIAQAALDAALHATGADMGNVQLRGGEGLVISAQRGFEQPFLDYFSCVKREGTCGAAQHLRKRVVVPNVSRDPIFAGTRAAEVMEEAHARACQSTPMFGASGEIIGVLSTHYDKPRYPGAHELGILDYIASRTAICLDRAPA